MTRRTLITAAALVAAAIAVAILAGAAVRSSEPGRVKPSAMQAALARYGYPLPLVIDDLEPSCVRLGDVVVATSRGCDELESSSCDTFDDCTTSVRLGRNVWLEWVTSSRRPAELELAARAALRDLR